jgi:hypothetical protein
MLDSITPVILTFNEAPNIARTLEKLKWAKDIVVVDSFSTDATLDVLAANPTVRIFRRNLTTLADQWNFAVSETGITTNWVLRLDADYVLTEELTSEIAGLQPPPSIGAYRVNFIYCIHGKRLRASVYPPACKLFRRQGLSFFQDGHTERPQHAGAEARLAGHILHDDRKPLTHWLWSQGRYMAAEARKISERGPAELDLIDKIRRWRGLSPILVLFHCLFAKGLILDGKAGLYYAYQRMMAEAILSLNLLDNDLLDRDAQGNHRPRADR